jgi:glucose-6-phosphate 1-dehydrogenase
MGKTCTALVVFGITGDLAYKKVFSALYSLASENLPDAEQMRVPVIGVGRSNWDDDKLRTTAERAIREDAQKRSDAVQEDTLASFLSRLQYIQGDYADPALYAQIASCVAEQELVLLYLAVPPTVFESVISGVAESGLGPRARLLVEKPFGTDFDSANNLASAIHARYETDQLFAVDHYLQKEALQNISVLRFANPVFEALWSNEYIASIDITMSEDFGIGERAGFFDSNGTLRDVFQNHALQIVASLAMEAPKGDMARDVSRQRSELLKLIKPLATPDVLFGQYIGYTDVTGVAEDSITDTFVRARLEIAHPRWEGVRWTVTAGKALPETGTKVVVTFIDSGTVNFIGNECQPEANRLVIHLAPDERIELSFQTRSATVPMGTSLAVLTTKDDYRSLTTMDAYARLFLDAAAGDQTHFASIAEVLASWKIVDAVVTRTSSPATYQQGTWGPTQESLS